MGTWSGKLTKVGRRTVTIGIVNIKFDFFFGKIGRNP